MLLRPFWQITIKRKISALNPLNSRQQHHTLRHWHKQCVGLTTGRERCTRFQLIIICINYFKLPTPISRTRAVFTWHSNSSPFVVQTPPYSVWLHFYQKGHVKFKFLQRDWEIFWKALNSDSWHRRITEVNASHLTVWDAQNTITVRLTFLRELRGSRGVASWRVGRSFRACVLFFLPSHDVVSIRWATLTFDGQPHLQQ